MVYRVQGEGTSAVFADVTPRTRDCVSLTSLHHIARVQEIPYTLNTYPLKEYTLL